MNPSISILGCGNIGSSVAKGLVRSKHFKAKDIFLTRRNLNLLKKLKNDGFNITSDNKTATNNTTIIILAVAPSELTDLLTNISSLINKNHLIISFVSGVEIKSIQNVIGTNIPIIRAMPNTAAELCESMTCLATTDNFSKELNIAERLFDKIGKTLIINETQMASATALGACGVAFFLRAIRAASQGGIEIGFHADQAFTIAAQTAKGSASLLLNNKAHPESEIDRVTTPRGATISGLNEMEHRGFSSALIKGITVSSKKVTKLFIEE